MTERTLEPGVLRVASAFPDPPFEVTIDGKHTGFHPQERGGAPTQPMRRRQSEVEAAISDEVMAFQHGFVGRGPERIRTLMVDDLVIVRSFGVLTPAEKRPADSHQGRGLIKAMRQQVLGAGRSVLEGIIKKHTGVEVISIHSDISAKSGEWQDVFVLECSLEEEKR